MGKKRHNGGKMPSTSIDKDEFKRSVAIALKQELGGSHRAIKTVMGWTKASERTVKHWFAGTHGPSGHHLIAIVSNSDAVMNYVLLASHRPSIAVGSDMLGLRDYLVDLVEKIDACERM